MAELVKQPVITVPTIVLHGESDSVSPPKPSERHNRFFTGPYHDASCRSWAISSREKRPRQWCNRFAILALNDETELPTFTDTRSVIVS